MHTSKRAISSFNFGEKNLHLTWCSSESNLRIRNAKRQIFWWWRSQWCYFLRWCLYGFLMNHSRWWFQPIGKKKCQNGNLPQIGVKIKKFWNHHLDKALLKWMIWRPATIFWKHPFHLSYPNNLDHTNRTGSHLGRSSVRSMYPAVGDTIHKRIRRLAATTKRPGS